MDTGQKTDPSIGSLAFTVVLWLLAGYIFTGAFDFAYPANVAPTIIGGCAFALMTGLLVREVVRLLRRRPRPGADRGHRHEAVTLGWVAGSIGLLFLLGFLAGMSLAMVALLRGYSRESWPTTVAVTAGVMVTVYLAFAVGLDVPVFGGLLGGG
ncbi:tripartite tricarboxylate transporter TctB family protein [Jiangella asiatica]|uniref:DUF1468 domain-containing protein n=1 Tax=Jiangella asiatica TaxID=2530372 RepID=A0A4R5CMY3_9ACTN|nr:tripartite tricarboxylate transporter TctB family protein [Jiangella asiatica]TDE00687.1 hypothetical protein E1269_24820 [Jiangella asiatica]